MPRASLNSFCLPASAITSLEYSPASHCHPSSTEGRIAFDGASTSLRRGSTCWTTLSGSKSSILLNLSSTPILVPSSWSLFSERTKARLHSGHYLVEIVAVDLHKLPVFDRRQRLFGLSGKIAKDPDHKRQFLQLRWPRLFLRHT